MIKQESLFFTFGILISVLLVGGCIGGTMSSQTEAMGRGGAAMQKTGKLGYSTGGAKDINNFRDNINNSYLPLVTDIPYEGLYYEYYFDTGQKKECKELFCPSYSRAVTRDPLSDEKEYYMTVGLNSNLKAEDFERKKLNLVIVLDISGSMSSSFSKYYYDKFGNRCQVENHTGKTKMEAAAESLVALTKHLESGDRLGVVLFSGDSRKMQVLKNVGEMDMESLRQRILGINADGSTNMAAGINEATQMLDKYKGVDKGEYENRVFFLTDAMPNVGTRSEGGLLGKMEDNAEDGIYTTFVGIGVDLNTKLVDAITKIKGANSFAVHSSQQFSERMDKDFKYMVTPLVFDLDLTLDSESYEIEKVYGSTAAEESTGRIMKVKTLFPSRRKENKTKGGIVLLQLDKVGQDSKVNLEVSYKTRGGQQKSSDRTVSFKARKPEYFENSGIEKAVLLTRYSNLMKNWIIYERDQISDEDVPDRVCEIAKAEGINPPANFTGLGKWERQSTPLQVSQKYKAKISSFEKHFEKKMRDLEDENLGQELKILRKLSTYEQNKE